MDSRNDATAIESDVEVADRLATLGLIGVLLSLATWSLLALVDVVFDQSTSLGTAIVEPTSHEALVRLSAIVLVLGTTLMVQTFTKQRARVQTDLAFEHGRLRQMYEHSPEAIMCLNRDLTIAYSNPVAGELFAAYADGDTLEGMHCCNVLWPEGQAGACLGEQVLAAREMRQRTVHDMRDGREFWFEEVVYPVFDQQGEVEQLVEIVRDVTEQVSAQRTIYRMAYHDTVTNLPNRVLFQDRLSNALLHAKRRSEIVAVCYVDIDDFKSINDGLGHEAGDVVLREAASALLDELRDEDTVARLGGDEFMIVARLAAKGDADLLAERILRCLKRDIEIDGHRLTVSASAGVAIYPFDAETESDLVKNADAAMYRAKELGHNQYRLYTADMSRSAEERLRLEMHLHHALDNGEFELYYQPQIDSRSGRPVGVEALIRWNHPVDGLLAPGAFIEFAEQAGFMGDIGPWVIRTACAQGRAWLDDGFDFGRMAVNISAREFEQYDVFEVVSAALAETGLEPTRLEIEITETAVMKHADVILETLHKLRAIRVRVAIDDFGTGYSSMSYLQRFPVQTLKIAQAFMRGVHRDSQSGAIATMLIDLCRELNLDIVAEGVEHAGELEFLRKQGCFIIQGYIFSPPLPAREVRELLGAAEGVVA